MADKPATQNEEEFSTFGAALNAIKELEVFVSLCWEGLGYAEVSHEVVEVVQRIRRRRNENPAPPEVLAKALEHSKKLEAFAATQRPLGFPYLYGLASVRLWNILEVFVEDLFIDLVANNLEVRNFPKIRDLKGPLVEFANSPASKQAELILNLLVGEVAASLRRGVDRFESVFKAIDLGGPVNEDVRRCFVELQEVRNIVAHRRGVADERFVTNCPWFGAKAGQLIRIPPLAFERYIFSAHWYLVEISRRVVARYPSESPKTIDSSSEGHVELLDKLADVIARLAVSGQQTRE